MVDIVRTRLGQINGIYDLWVSQPGIDVRSALPGEFLLGGQSGVNQIVHSGLQKMQGPGVLHFPMDYPAINLPASVAGLSNLFVHGLLWMASNTDSNAIAVGSAADDFYTRGPNVGTFRVLNGQLKIRSGGNETNMGVASNTNAIWARWQIFKRQY